jgi:hypothetical protein
MFIEQERRAFQGRTGMGAYLACRRLLVGLAFLVLVAGCAGNGSPTPTPTSTPGPLATVCGHARPNSYVAADTHARRHPDAGPDTHASATKPGACKPVGSSPLRGDP